MVLPIKKGIIYGPVNSRRLGNSLGINLMPRGKKYCDFNCLYCHYGRTTYHKYEPGPYDIFPSFEDVLAAVEQYLKSDIEFGYLTFSGNGEPTLHPEFPEIARQCQRLVRKLRPEVKLTLLSNSSTCNESRIIDAMEFIDLPIMKLDAGSEELFKRINQPVEEIKFQSVIDGLAAMENVTIQALLLAGDPDNSTPEAVGQWYDRLRRIKPVDIQIYTLDRPFARRTKEGKVRISRVGDERMQEIVDIGRHHYALSISRY